MKAQKVTVTIVVETLSIDSVRSVLAQAGEQIHLEVAEGRLRMEDGDQVEWETTFTDVDF